MNSTKDHAWGGRRNAAASETIPEAAPVLGVDGSVVEANELAERLSRERSGDLIGLSLDGLVGPDDEKLVTQWIGETWSSSGAGSRSGTHELRGSARPSDGACEKHRA